MTGPSPPRPTREALVAAAGRTIPDVLAPDLRVLFVGINPGLYSGAVGHHFARPGNRFWKALAGAGLTDRVLSPFDDAMLPRFGIGVTNLVRRATTSAAELSAQELREGARRVERVIRRSRPGTVAFLGIGTYRVAFDRPKAEVGEQADRLTGATVWVLPNPSGLNAHHQLPDLIRLFGELRASLR